MSCRGRVGAREVDATRDALPLRRHLEQQQDLCATYRRMLQLKHTCHSECLRCFEIIKKNIFYFQIFPYQKVFQQVISGQMEPFRNLTFLEFQS